MKFTPYDYQRRAIAWIIDHEACALFCDMGLGKTVITLTALRRLRDDYFETAPALVIAPKKVAESTWTAECAKWDHLRDMRVAPMLGTAAQRRRALAGEADVYVISRDNFVWLCAELARRPWPFGAVVIDELTSFKTRGSKRNRAFRLMRPDMRRVIGLTGTPAPNGLLDLWGQMACVDGGERLGKAYTRYRSRYFDCVERNHIVIKSSPREGARDEILARLADICLTMRASDYLTLPSLRVVDVPVRLDPAARMVYDTMAREQVAELSGHEVTAASAAALVNKLAQVASGCVYVDGGGSRHVHTAKLDCLREIVEGAQGQPVLVYYRFRSDIVRIAEALAKDGVEARLYEGPEELDAWNRGEIPVLLAHPASVAYGLNMQAGGHYIVWYGLDYSLEQYQQANARLHRQGQRYPVTVYRLIAADTVDEHIAAALDGKCESQSALLDGFREIQKLYSA